jgi:geranylgeranyl diphosphate synthase type II
MRRFSINFKEYIEQYRQKVYSKICEYVPLREKEGNANRIMRDYIDRQGSYRRPGLVLLTGELFGGKEEDLILPAAAEQLSEDWILMQDDTEDDSELRRGKPAVQRIHGWVHAFNATNAGQMAMWRMLKDYMKIYPEKGDRLYEKFYHMLDYTVEGQHVENQFIHHTKDLSKADEALYYRILDSKTCYNTVYGPMQLGAIAAGQTGETLEMLREIGKPAGIAFQIVDDILDMTADEKIFGKKNFGDLYEGKVTLMILKTYKDATPEEKAKIDVIYRKKRQDKTEEEIGFLKEMIGKYDGLGYAQQKAEFYGNKAKEALDGYKDRLPMNDLTPLVCSAMEELYVRKK